MIVVSGLNRSPRRPLCELFLSQPRARPTDGSFCDGIVVISLTVAGLRILVDSRELPFLSTRQPPFMMAAQITDRSSAFENTPALPELPPMIILAIGS